MTKIDEFQSETFANTGKNARAHAKPSENIWFWPVVVIGFCTLITAVIFVPRVIHYSSNGVWKNVSTAIHVAPDLFLFHSIFALGVLILLTTQPILGYFTLRGSAVAYRIHKPIGYLFFASMVVANIAGLSIVAKNFLVGDGTFSVLVSTAAMALLSALFFAIAILNARRGNLSGHLESIVFATLIVTAPAGVRTVETIMIWSGIDDPRSGVLISMFGLFSFQSHHLIIILTQVTIFSIWIAFLLARRGMVRNYGKTLLLGGATLATVYPALG